ncbi:MAG: hypothetical protein BMS9Abin22_336 [Gammaproteobacteria bacterium]|nr:MAG: hypothetical protein BMS9Abin22_336 [Gammaproteobacteria bacterium]
MKKLFSTAFSSTIMIGLLSAAPVLAQDNMPFGGPDSLKYAGKLWRALVKTNLVGDNATTSKPYKGTHPHGAVLDTIESTVKVKGHRGAVIIKRNYGGKKVSVGKVANDPKKYLKAVTVMFKREKGYDPEDRDWFWVKYSPKGDVLKNPKGMSLAGRVAKGKPKGCIACHRAAPGGDLVYLHDRYAE